MAMDRGRFLTRFTIALSDRLFPHPWAELSAAERVVVLVDWLEREVNNGGFHQFYFNSAGDCANQTPAALRAIGACQVAAIVEQANALFPGGAPPVDRSERQCVLDEIDPDIHIFNQLDRRFYAYPDEISTLVYDFVAAHRDQIRGA